MASRRCGHYGYVVCTLVVAISEVWGLRTSLYSTKTGYEDSFEVVGGLSRDLSWTELATELGEESETENCEPVKVYALHRHGTRYPSDDDIVIFQSFLNRLKASSINPEYEYLKDEPQDRFTLDKASQLGEEGFEEMSDIASRIKTRFPTLYRNSSSLLRDSSFQSTDTDRTRDSAKGFVSGFVEGCTFEEANEGFIDASCPTDGGDMVPATVFWLPEEGDLLLEPQDNCQLYNDLKDEAELDDEYVGFSKGPEVRQVQTNMEALLAGEEEFPVSVEEVVTLQKVCGMERALFGNSSWCDLFQTSDLRVIEYLEDLDEYWYSSYGNPINYASFCVLVQNITSFLRLGVQEESSILKGLYKFAHSDTVQGLLTIMDLYQPSVTPRADNYPIDEDWDYAAAVIVPFASNVAFTLFRCADGETVAEDDFKVLVTHNEQPIKVGPCETYFCLYTTLTSFLTSQAGSCDVDAICNNTSHLTMNPLLWLILLLMKYFLK